MIGQNYCPLGAAIVAALPGAEIVSRRARDWHSATFSGERVELELATDTDADPMKLSEFCETLSEREFDLRRMFVADILVKDKRLDPVGRSILILEALLVEQ